MRDLSTTLCRGITRQVLATVPLRARLNGRPVVAGLPVPTDDLVPVAAGRPDYPFNPHRTPSPFPDRYPIVVPFGLLRAQVRVLTTEHTVCPAEDHACRGPRMPPNRHPIADGDALHPLWPQVRGRYSLQVSYASKLCTLNGYIISQQASTQHLGAVEIWPQVTRPGCRAQWVTPV